MNDFNDNADWEKLVALSDEELEAAIAKQKRDTQPSTKKSAAPNGTNLDQLDQGAIGWNYLLDPSANGVAQQPANNSTFTDWETVNDSPKSLNGKERDSVAEAWGKASEEVNTEFAQQWEQSAAQILNQNQGETDEIESESFDLSPNVPPASNWEAEYNFNADEVIPDWEQFSDLSSDNSLKPDTDITASWQMDTDEVNTEFMHEWEQSAARISELTGIDLSDGITPDRPTSPKIDRFSAGQKKMPPQSSDESGPLPPLPVLPPRKTPSKKTVIEVPKKQTPQNPVTESVITQAPIAASESDWFEKYHDESKNTKPKSPKPAYHFDQLAEEMCESDEFSWANLNPKAQPKPVAKTWNPAEKIVVDLGDEQADATAVWNYNPPESFTETGLVSDFKPKPSFNFKLAFSQFYADVCIPFWRKFKIPVIAISAIGGIFALYLIPPVQRVVTETGLKSQLLKDASQKDLSASNFQNVKLERVDFSNANLSGANFKRANLNGANLSGSNLKGANFLGANLRAVSLKDSKIELNGSKTTKLEPKDLLMWRIVNQPITARNLSNQNLDGFYLGGAMLKKANFTEAKLSWVNFMNADLSEAQLAGATITGVNLVGANLRGANFNGVTWGKHEPRTDSTTTCPNGTKGPCKF